MGTRKCELSRPHYKWINVIIAIQWKHASCVRFPVRIRRNKRSSRKQDRRKRSAGNNGGPLSVLMYNRRTRFLLRRRRIASWAYVFSGLPDFMIDPEPNHKLYRLAHRLADNGKPDKNICWILFQWICLFELSIVFQYEGFAKRMTCKARRWFEKYSAPVPWSRFLHYTLGSVLKRTTAHRILFLSNYKTTTRPGTESLRSSLALNLRVTQSTSWRSHIKLMMDGLFGGFHAEYKRSAKSKQKFTSLDSSFIEFLRSEKNNRTFGKASGLFALDIWLLTLW